jgi:hypothetical protein
MSLTAAGGGGVERAGGVFNNATENNNNNNIIMENTHGGRGGSLQFNFSPMMMVVFVTLAICFVVIVPVSYRMCRKWWCGDNDSIVAEQQQNGSTEQRAAGEEKDTAEKKVAAEKMIKSYILRKSIVSHLAGYDSYVVLQFAT